MNSFLKKNEQNAITTLLIALILYTFYELASVKDKDKGRVHIIIFSTTWVGSLIILGFIHLIIANELNRIFNLVLVVDLPTNISFLIIASFILFLISVGSGFYLANDNKWILKYWGISIGIQLFLSLILIAFLPLELVIFLSLFLIQSFVLSLGLSNNIIETKSLEDEFVFLNSAILFLLVSILSFFAFLAFFYLPIVLFLSVLVWMFTNDGSGSITILEKSLTYIISVILVWIIYRVAVVDKQTIRRLFPRFLLFLLIWDSIDLMFAISSSSSSFQLIEYLISLSLLSILLLVQVFIGLWMVSIFLTAIQEHHENNDDTDKKKDYYKNILVNMEELFS